MFLCKYSDLPSILAKCRLDALMNVFFLLKGCHKIQDCDNEQRISSRVLASSATDFPVG